MHFWSTILRDAGGEAGIVNLTANPALFQETQSVLLISHKTLIKVTAETLREEALI